MKPTTAEQSMLFLDRFVECEQRAARSTQHALQRIAAGDLDEAKADLKQALAEVERGLLWKHQRDRLTH